MKKATITLEIEVEVDDWEKYVAVDEDGDVCSFRTKPVNRISKDSSKIGYWITRKSEPFSPEVLRHRVKNWRETLTKVE